mmetsp:Transcript_35868/g.82335  ORF Transcript_35868/g.82335 Transcript_35868/m.82335 type:complete len:218 (+) Transcript_35868:348-1001(+)
MYGWPLASQSPMDISPNTNATAGVAASRSQNSISTRALCSLSIKPHGNGEQVAVATKASSPRHQPSGNESTPRHHSPLMITLCGRSWKIGVAPKMFNALMTIVSRCGLSRTSPRWPPGSLPSLSMRPPQWAKSCPVSRQITKRKSVFGRMQGTCRLLDSSPNKAPSTKGHPLSPHRPILPSPIMMDAAVSEASANCRMTSTLASGSVRTKPLRRGTA